MPIKLTIDSKDPLLGACHDIFPEALHALEGIKNKTCLGADLTDWFDWPQKGGLNLVDEIQSWQKEFTPPFDLIVVCGIGGSFCGTRAVEQALSSPYQIDFDAVGKKGSIKRIVYTGHNLCETELIDLLELLDHRLPILNVVSKSGTTTETSIAFRILREYFENRFGKEAASRRIIATTDKNHGVLRALADKEGYHSFSIPQGIGGRFSVLTAVGLVPLSLAGMPISQFLAGAESVFSSLRAPNIDHNHPCIKLACLRKAAWDSGKQIDVMAYNEPRLASFIEWWKQLFGESEGKNDKGLFPCGMQYSTDLHSLGQLMQDGNPCMIETFLSIRKKEAASSGIVKSLIIPKAPELKDKLEAIEGRSIGDINDAAMKAALDAHRDRGLSCVELEIDALDAFHLGALFSFFESVCAISALLLEVNPFTQDGVEAYKKNLFQSLGIRR